MKLIACLTVLLCLSACQQTPNKTIQKQDIDQTIKKNQPKVKKELKQKSNSITIAKQPHEHDDVWQRIRSQLTIKVPNNPAVAKWRKYYLSHPNFMVTIAKRAEPFLYYIVEEIEKRNMPVELALLPIVESAYLPYGVSNKSATGLWQFMPVSAKRFKLENNWWYDGRRDIVESTRAALDYFQFFHKTFNQDWLNAIAAFNSGEGRVGRAITRNRKANLATDFWSLRLPAETNDFVPKLLAIADILKHASKLNYKFTPIKNSPAVALVKLDSQLDLALAAQWSNTKPNKLLQLNPALNHWTTAPGNHYQLLIPIDNVDYLNDKLATTNKKDWLQWRRYQVKSGDNLSEIAVKYATTVAVIKKVNHLNSDAIRIGKMLMLPLTKNTSHPWQLANRTQKKLIYTIKSGDNLWDISRKYKVKVKDIMQWNKLSNDSLLQPKQKLSILL